jgi:tRNA A37 threonylcarbamoyladenosine biosynthesis protein TsaE
VSFETGAKKKKNNIRYQYLLHALVSSGHSVLLNGEMGTGKTVVVQNFLATLGRPRTFQTDRIF